MQNDNSDRPKPKIESDEGETPTLENIKKIKCLKNSHKALYQKVMKILQIKDEISHQRTMKLISLLP